MLVDFFMEVRAAGVPATPRELLDLIRALEQDLAFADWDEFYLLARTCLVKDEKFYDRFDLAFGSYFEGLADLDELLHQVIPDEWLRQTFERFLSEQDKVQLNSLASLDELMKQFQERLKEQQERHAGGNKWVGTGGTSPFGHGGYHPQGVRVGGESRHQRAAKVWQTRHFRNLDDSVALGTRNIKVALKRLRQFARNGAQEELALDETIRATARNGGYLDLQLRRERHNAVKVLLFLDIGGSMDAHIAQLEALFSACRSEFKHLEFFYFHNCLYESVWRDNVRRMNERTSTMSLLHTFAEDYKVIFVGDASMAPWEISAPGGSVEHFNDEAGAVWLERVTQKWPHCVWLNPIPERHWDYTPSIGMVRQLVDQRMFPLTLEGLDQATRALMR